MDASGHLADGVWKTFYNPRRQHSGIDYQSPLRNKSSPRTEKTNLHTNNKPAGFIEEGSPLLHELVQSRLFHTK